jgi:hypothetical protein
MTAIIGGWEISAFALFQGGNPLQPSQNGGTMQNGGTQRPNLIGDPSTSGPVVDRLNGGYFNRNAFTQPIADVFGTAPRYLNYRGPGIKTVDAALLKSIATREGQRFEFRLEATNFTNTPTFGDPNTSFGNSNFGTITGTKIGSRNVQLGFSITSSAESATRQPQPVGPFAVVAHPPTRAWVRPRAVSAAPRPRRARLASRLGRPLRG